MCVEMGVSINMHFINRVSELKKKFKHGIHSKWHKIFPHVDT